MPAAAATKTWLSAGGANATNWNRAQNWSPNGAPGTTDDIVIPTTPANGTGFPVLNATSTIATLTIQTGANLTGAAGFNLTVTGNSSVTGTGALNVNASTMSVGGTLSGTGTVNGNTGTLNLAGAMTVTTFNQGTGTVVYNGTAAQDLGVTYTYNNLTIANTSATVSASANFAVNATFNMNGAATILSPAAGVVVSGTGTLTGTGTARVTRIAATADFDSQYTITNKTLTNLTVDYIGTAAQVVSARTYGNLSISNTSATVSAPANFSVNGTLTMNGASTVLSPAAAVVVGGTGTLTGTGTVQATRTAATADFSSQYSISNKTLTNLTVDYAGAAAQSVSALTYGGLRISNTSAAVSAAANFSVNGTLTMNGASTVLRPAAAVVVGGTGTLTGTGTVQVTRTAATADFNTQYTISNKSLVNLTVEYTGAAAQNLSAITYGSLKINNASGVSLTAGNATASGTLTLASGVVSTGANTLLTTADCPASVSRPGGGGHVAGLLRLHVPTGSPSCTFDIGDASNYRSIALALPSVSTAGDLTATVSQVAGEHPSIGSSGIDSANDVNRFWTLTNSGIVLGANYSATFAFAAADVDAGADPLTFEIERWDGSAWNTTTAAGATATSTSASAISAFSDFASGKKKFTAANGSFNVFEPTTAANAVSGVVKTKVAGSGFNLDIVAIVGGAQFNGFNDSVTVDLIGNNTTGVGLDANNCPTSSSTVLASFTAAIKNGRSTITFAAAVNSWRDVRARVRWPTATPTLTRCSTDNFAVRPDKITVSAHDATWETAGTTRALANTGATGGNVHKASTSAAGAGARPFTLRATASPASATNYNGSPIPGAGFPACGSLCPSAVGTLTFGSVSWTGTGTGVSEKSSRRRLSS